MSHAHDGVELARLREDRGGAGFPSLKMVAALVAIAYLFRVALVAEKGAVGYGQMVSPLADMGSWGEMLAALLLPDRLTLFLAEMLTHLI